MRLNAGVANHPFVLKGRGPPNPRSFDERDKSAKKRGLCCERKSKSDKEKSFEMKRISTAGLLSSAVLLASCSSTGGEIRSTLRSYGMNNDEARCVWRELDDSLTNQELRSVNRVLRATRNDRRSRPSRVIDAVRTLDDPEILQAVAIANAGCLLLN